MDVPEPHTSTWRFRFAARVRQVTSGLLLIASAILIGRTIVNAQSRESINAAPELAPLADEEQKRRARDVIGMFSTGDQPGDRTIVVTAEGEVHFFLQGPLREVMSTSDTYNVGLRAGKLCLATKSSGAIDILDIDRLTYFDDIYRRAE